MRIVKVTYTARPEFVAKNSENINAVMSELRALGNAGIRYSTYLGDDGKTFMHFAHFADELLPQVLFGLESFKTFQQQLKESNPEAPIKQEVMTMVASSYDIL